MKKVFVTGSNGLIGSRFVELFEKNYHLLTPEIDELDLTDKSAVEKYLGKEEPDVIVHFAAFTDVSGAEKQRGEAEGSCWKVNVDAVKNLVGAIDKDKTRFIQISTDMVFAGREADPGPYAEDHQTEISSDKLTWYGWTKAEAERIVQESLGKKAAIVRLVYPVRASFKNKLDYIRTPLKLFDEGKLYPLFDDQQISITFIDDVPEVVTKIIEMEKYGIFHVSSSDITNPNELISYVLNKTGRYEGEYNKSSLKEYLKEHKDAHWPLLGGLKVEKTQSDLDIKFKTWKEIVDELVEQGLNI